MQKIVRIIIGLPILLFGCSNNENEVSSQQNRHVDLDTINESHQLLDLDQNLEVDEVDMHKYYAWNGHKGMRSSGSFISLQNEIEIKTGTAVIHSESSATSDAWVYLYNSDSIQVGSFHANPANYAKNEVDLILNDSNQTAVEVAYIALYSWWNSSTLKGIHFQSTSLIGEGPDTLELPVAEPVVQEYHNFDDLCAYWVGRKVVDEHKKIISFPEEVMVHYGQALVHAAGNTDAEFRIDAFNADSVRVGVFNGKMSNASELIVDFTILGEDVFNAFVSYLEFYTFKGEARLLQIDLCFFEDEGGC